MRAIAGALSLLVALAIVGLVATRQLKATARAASPAASTAGEGVAMPSLSGSGSAAEQTRRVEQQVGADIAKSLAEGAARQAEAEKP